ncbi:MAG: hypothetical protein C5B49_06450 [Bdellovibrio sp.]|nr:MAG: hypothetical protein C5B49_06450 [Bdellovibrio sp.]
MIFVLLMYVAASPPTLFARGAFNLGAPFFLLPVSAAENYKDVIERAQQLSLRHERSRAIQLLLKTVQKDAKKGTAPKEVSAALEDIAMDFYGEKSQQLYELAISNRLNNPPMALQWLTEAQKVEPDNAQIRLEISRTSLLLGDCSHAESEITALLKEIPVLEALQLGAAQVEVCQGRFEKAAQLRSAVDTKKSNFTVFWLSLEADRSIRSGQHQKASDLADQMTAVDARFPEAHYWKWKSLTEQKMAAELPAQDYISHCRKLTPRQIRDYLPEPMLCRRLSEVEASLKKQ